MMGLMENWKTCDSPSSSRWMMLSMLISPSAIFVLLSSGFLGAGGGAGRPGRAHPAPERLSELTSDWSSLILVLWLAEANLDSNWQKRALGLSARLLTTPLPLADKNESQSSETNNRYYSDKHLRLQFVWPRNWWSFNNCHLSVRFWAVQCSSRGDEWWIQVTGLDSIEAQGQQQKEAAGLAIGRTKSTGHPSDFGHKSQVQFRLIQWNQSMLGWKCRSLIAACKILKISFKVALMNGP